MTLEIRRYAPDDRDELLAVWLDASRVGHPFLSEADLAWQRQLIIDVHLPEAETWVALEDGRIVGGIGLHDGFVGGLFVLPERHRSGIGRRLLAHATALKGRLTLEVYAANVAAHAFYARCGFVAVGRKEVDDQGRPFPLLIMALP
jgi:putative acetyltransferase